MNYRKTSIYEQTDATTAKTETIDLDLSEIISRLTVKFNATNATTDPVAHPAAQVSKVEIVDGSDVLQSLSARQIEALMFYETGKSRGRIIEYRNGNENFMVLDLYFGRYLWDPILALDPKKFTNPQLKITHNKASGGCTPTAATLEVFADVFDEKPVSPIGFIMNKEFYAWTSGSAQANEYIDLPNDHPIKRIMLETFKVDLWMHNIISEVELDEENKKRLPWSLNMYDLMMLVGAQYGPYKESFFGQLESTTPNRFFITPEEEVDMSFAQFSATNYVRPETDAQGCQVNLVALGSVNFRCGISGPYPHGTIPLDCGIQTDHNDWYDVTKKGKLKLRIKAGSTADIKVILQQLRKY